MPKKNLLLSVLSGIFLAVHFVLWFASLQHTSVASSTTIVCTEVIWVALGFCLFFRGRLHWKAVLAIGIAVVGSVLIAWSDSGTATGHLYGDILALIAAIVEAGYTLIGQRMRKTTSTTAYTYVVYVSCVAVLLVSVLVQGYNVLGYGFSPVLVGLLLSVFSTILGHSIFSWCLKFLSPSFVSASKLCEPVVAAIMAAFLFGEMPVPLQIVGGAMIIGGVLFSSRLESEGA